jgi:hypothetical protein
MSCAYNPHISSFLVLEISVIDALDVIYLGELCSIIHITWDYVTSIYGSLLKLCLTLY